jgi:hypothetical protein
MARSLVAVLALAAASSRAAAQVAPEDREPGLPDRAHLPDPTAHLELGVGIDFGVAAIGTTSEGYGIHALAGLRLDRAAVLVELDGGITSDTKNRYGVIGRGALEARLSLWRGRVSAGGSARRHGRPGSPDTMMARGEVWIEPAIGYEYATQPIGMAVQRPDVSFAVGYQQTAWDEAGKFGGHYLAVRVLDAAAPASVAPGGRDYGVMLVAGFVFGS